MSTEFSHQADGWKCAAEALAEMRSYPDRLHAFRSDMFNRFDGLTTEVIDQERPSGQARTQKDPRELQAQIDQLASIASELSRTLEEQNKRNGTRELSELDTDD